MELADRVLTLLEGCVELEIDIIAYTRVHKFMRGILRMKDVPRDGKFGFKRRCQFFLEGYQAAIRAADEELEGVEMVL